MYLFFLQAMLNTSRTEARTMPNSTTVPTTTSSPIEIDDTSRKWLLGGENEPAVSIPQYIANDQCHEQCYIITMINLPKWWAPMG